MMISDQQFKSQIVAIEENMDKTKGLIVAESVMMSLAPNLGRQVAHDLVLSLIQI